jgi:hypothetical protein
MQKVVAETVGRRDSELRTMASGAIGRHDEAPRTLERPPASAVAPVHGRPA